MVHAGLNRSDLRQVRRRHAKRWGLFRCRAAFVRSSSSRNGPTPPMLWRARRIAISPRRGTSRHRLPVTRRRGAAPEASPAAGSLVRARGLFIERCFRVKHKLPAATGRDGHRPGLTAHGLCDRANFFQWRNQHASRWARDGAAICLGLAVSRQEGFAGVHQHWGDPGGCCLNNLRAPMRARIQPSRS